MVELKSSDLTLSPPAFWYYDKHRGRGGRKGLSHRNRSKRGTNVFKLTVSQHLGRPPELNNMTFMAFEIDLTPLPSIRKSLYK